MPEWCIKAGPEFSGMYVGGSDLFTTKFGNYSHTKREDTNLNTILIVCLLPKSDILEETAAIKWKHIKEKIAEIGHVKI